MSEELASSPSTAFCAESVATFDTVKAPAARIQCLRVYGRTTRQSAYNGESGGSGGNGVRMFSSSCVDELAGFEKSRDLLAAGDALTLVK